MPNVQTASTLIIRSTCSSSTLLHHPISCAINIHPATTGHENAEIQSFEFHPCGVDNVLLLWHLPIQEYFLSLVECSVLIQGKEVYLSPIPSVLGFDLRLQPFPEPTIGNTVSKLAQRSTEFNVQFIAKNSHGEGEQADETSCSLNNSDFFSSVMKRNPPKPHSLQLDSPTTDVSSTAINQLHDSARNLDQNELIQILERYAEQEAHVIEYEIIFIGLVSLLLILSFTFSLAIKCRQRKHRKSQQTSKHDVGSNKGLSSDIVSEESSVIYFSTKGNVNKIQLPQRGESNFQNVAQCMLKPLSSFDSWVPPNLKHEQTDHAISIDESTMTTPKQQSFGNPEEGNVPVAVEGKEEQVEKTPLAKKKAKRFVSNMKGDVCSIKQQCLPRESRSKDETLAQCANSSGKKEKDELLMETETKSIEMLTNSAKTSHKQPKRLIALISVGVSDRFQATNQARALALLEAKGAKYIVVNGMDPDQKKRRNELFRISNIKGNYPQFFLEHADGIRRYIGNLEYLQTLNDASSLPSEIHMLHPHLETWETVFDYLVLSFEDKIA